MIDSFPGITTQNQFIREKRAGSGNSGAGSDFSRHISEPSAASPESPQPHLNHSQPAAIYPLPCLNHSGIAAEIPGVAANHSLPHPEKPGIAAKEP